MDQSQHPGCPTGLTYVASLDELLKLVPNLLVLVPIEVVIALTGLRRTAIYARMDRKSPYFDADFPRVVKQGGRSTWELGALQRYITIQINKSQQL